MYWLKDEVARAVRPRSLELQDDAALGSETGSVLRHRFVHLNNAPGFGVEINWDYAKRYAA